MRCAKCGFDNNEGAKTCAKCGSFLDPDAEEKKRHRKVVQLPSNQPQEKTAAAKRPWEAQVPKRESDAATGAAKSPTPRRRAATTGKIPPIKHPSHEGGKIPADQRQQNDATKSLQGDRRGQSGAERTTQVIIDDAVLAAETATQAHAGRATSERSYPASNRMKPRRGMNTTKTLILGMAILILLCLVALGFFLVSSNSNAKTISFDTDGGTVIGNQYVMPSEKLDRPANPTRPGYVFDGWYLDPDYTEKAQFPIDVTQDLTLYAKWKKDGSTASGSGVPSTTTESTAQDPATPSSSNSGSTSNASNSAGASSGSGSTTRPNGSGNSGTGASGTRPSTSTPSTSGGSSSGSTGSAVNSNTASNGPVEVTLTASNGSKLTGTVTLHDGYVIPDSSTKAYTIEELRALNLNDAELCIARNEIYAREGYRFLNSGLQSYFNARSWYHNTGWRGQLPEGSAGYVTAHNLLALAKENPSSAKWTSLRHS